MAFTPSDDSDKSGHSPSLIIVRCTHEKSLHTQLSSEYHNDRKFKDRQVWANSVDPDQTAPSGVLVEQSD